MSKRTTEYSEQAVLNLVSRDTDSDDEPDAIAICNPDGSNVGS